MKVGDRIRVFEIKDHNYNTDKELKGLHRAEIQTTEAGIKELSTELYTSDIKELGFNAWFKRSNIKHVCTMVIKSIKQ